MIKTFFETNYNHTKQIAKKIVEIAEENGIRKVSILGIGYKQHTTDCRFSVSATIQEIMQLNGISCILYDLTGVETPRLLSHGASRIANTPEGALRGAKMAIITQDDERYGALPYDELMDKEGIIVDLWRICPNVEKKVIRLGIKN